MGGDFCFFLGLKVQVAEISGRYCRVVRTKSIEEIEDPVGDGGSWRGKRLMLVLFLYYRVGRDIFALELIDSLEDFRRSWRNWHWLQDVLQKAVSPPKKNEYSNSPKNKHNLKTARRSQFVSSKKNPFLHPTKKQQIQTPWFSTGVSTNLRIRSSFRSSN